MSKVITANILASGVVVFLGKDSHWVAHLADATVFDDETAAAGDLARAGVDAERAIIVDPFITDIRSDVAENPVMSLRDRIRAFGPTIDYLPKINLPLEGEKECTDMTSSTPASSPNGSLSSAIKSSGGLPAR